MLFLYGFTLIKCVIKQVLFYRKLFVLIREYYVVFAYEWTRSVPWRIKCSRVA
jgi:hypothetical protein